MPKRIRTTLRGVVLVLICAGCVSVGTAAAISGATTASNKRTAVLDAKHLLLGVMPPSGAVVQSSGTAIGRDAQLLTAAFASATSYSTWTVPDDPASVLSFVEAHLPPGSTLVGSGTSGPSPSTRSVIRSWPPVDGVIGVRWLEVDVTSRASGGTLLHAESQSQWIVTRPSGETVPAGVREVDVASGWPGKAPFLSRRVTDRAKVRRLVALFDSLGIVQPGAISCPAELIKPIVHVAFRAGPRSRVLARASVSSSANLPWPASVPGWSCSPVSFSVLGRQARPLVGNVITPIERLLGVKLSSP
jgi:hypothetical protein